jgi:putative toxin-antitoxin system antitoxin component (TIGR02293 family)
MQKMDNPEISGVEYQQGTLAGYEVREYLLEKWGRKCVYCDKANVPLQIEHIDPRANGSTDRVNLARKEHRDRLAAFLDKGLILCHYGSIVSPDGTLTKGGKMSTPISRTSKPRRPVSRAWLRRRKVSTRRAYASHTLDDRMPKHSISEAVQALGHFRKKRQPFVTPVRTAPGIPILEFGDVVGDYAELDLGTVLGDFNIKLDEIEPTLSPSVVSSLKSIRVEGSFLDLIEQIKSGIPFSYLATLTAIIDTSQGRLGQSLEISKRTMARRRGEGKFTAEESERVMHLFKVVQKALDVFEGNLDSVRLWVKHPKKALGDKIPMDLASTAIGAQEVIDLLGRIDHGVYS